MSERVRWFYSFRSPYSYLAARRGLAVADAYDVAFDIRAIPPMVTRGVPLVPGKKKYIVLDAKRVARRLGMPFGKTRDPLGAGAERCLRVSEHAREVGKAGAFMRSALEGIWAEGAVVAEDAGLRLVAERAGLAWKDCQAALANPAYWDRVQENARLHAELGHWGVPTWELRGELFWGQDRIEALCRRLEEFGLKK